MGFCEEWAVERWLAEDAALDELDLFYELWNMDACDLADDDWSTVDWIGDDELTEDIWARFQAFCSSENDAGAGDEDLLPVDLTEEDVPEETSSADKANVDWSNHSHLCNLGSHSFDAV